MKLPDPMTTSASPTGERTIDHETYHLEEDDALWAFVRWISVRLLLGTITPADISNEARRFLEWNERYSDRVRWYT
jgi:hypothetical protein